MALKYYIEYNDIIGVSHRCEIHTQEDFEEEFYEEPIKIRGNIILEYGEIDDILHPLRGCALNLKLEADLNVNFEELYLEDEFTFNVKYIRNSEVKFNGWIDPSGVFQDYVNNKWEVSIDCIDGISTLKSKSYVYEDTGLRFSGKQSAIEIVSNCLKRTKLEHDIYVGVDFFPSGTSLTTSPFADVYFNSDRYVKNDNETVMSCFDVLSSILELYGAVISFHNNSWVIYKPNLLADQSNYIFWHYNYNGDIQPPTGQVNLDFSQDLGSQIDGYYPHHAGANQQLSIKKSTRAFKVFYEFGLSKSLYSNIYLENVSGNISEWTINDPSEVSFPPSNRGVRIVSLPFNSAVTDLMLTSDSRAVAINDRINFVVVFNKLDVNELLNGLFQVHITNGSDTYYLTINGTWTTNFQSRTINLTAPQGDTPIIYNIESDFIPIEGDIFMRIYRPYNDFDTNIINISECYLLPISSEEKKGRQITLQRTDINSSKVEETKTVFNGTEDSDLYLGTIYDYTIDTPVLGFTRKEPLSSGFLIGLMAEERIKMNSRPRRIFSGSVFGFFNYISLISINKLQGRYMPLKYIYNTSKNILDIKLIEVINTNVLSNVDYSVSIVYNETEEPTIN